MCDRATTNNPCLTPFCSSSSSPRCLTSGLTLRIDQLPCCPRLPCCKNPYGCSCSPRCPSDPMTVYFRAPPSLVTRPSCPTEEELCDVPLHRLTEVVSCPKCPPIPNREVRPTPRPAPIPFYHVEGSCPGIWKCPFTPAEEDALTGLGGRG